MNPRPCGVEGCSRDAVARGWCMVHYGRWRRHGSFDKRKPGTTPRPLPLRLFERSVQDVNDCWVWRGATTNGYGVIGVGSKLDGTKGTAQVHRLAYELFVGPVPPGLQLDHLCRNRACWKPLHLEPVTNRENSRRGLKGRLVTHCPKGHPYDDANTYYHPETRHRWCRACGREKAKHGYQERKANPMLIRKEIADLRTAIEASG